MTLREPDTFMFPPTNVCPAGLPAFGMRGAGGPEVLAVSGACAAGAGLCPAAAFCPAAASGAALASRYQLTITGMPNKTAVNPLMMLDRESALASEPVI